MSAPDLVADLLEHLRPGVAPDVVAAAQTALLEGRREAEVAVLDADLARLVEALGEADRGVVARGIAGITGGALVEHGGSTRALGSALLAHLPDVLGPAARFAEACAAAVPEDYEPAEDAELLEVREQMVPLELVQRLASDDPDGAIAWQALDYWALPTIACLTRDPGLREVARAAPEVRKLAFGAVGYRGFLTIALDLLDDETLLVLHPSTQQGFEVTISGVPGNFDLHVLLADALIRDETGGPADGLPGQRPDPAAVAATRGERGEPAPCQGHWNVYDGRALASGVVPDDVPTELWIWNEGRPSDIPELEGRRVVVLAPPSYARTWTAQPVFGGLRPALSIERTLGEAEVRGWIGRLTRN